MIRYMLHTFGLHHHVTVRGPGYDDYYWCHDCGRGWGHQHTLWCEHRRYA